MAATRRLVPQDGTSLHHAFSAARAVSPPPDNIILIIDSLPTQGDSPPRGDTVSGRARLRNFNLSVGITNAFMEALDKDTEYELKDPRSGEVSSGLRAKELREKE